jgi:hypothetical protein
MDNRRIFIIVYDYSQWGDTTLRFTYIGETSAVSRHENYLLIFFGDLGQNDVKELIPIAKASKLISPTNFANVNEP